MKKSILTCVTALTVLFCPALRVPAADPPAKASLDVLKMKEVPEGLYDVQLQLVGSTQTVKLATKNNRVAFVKASDDKLDGLEGGFQFIGNGVFMARLVGKNYRAIQYWIFHSDGTATVKEMPDRGEKQTATPTSEK